MTHPMQAQPAHAGSGAFLWEVSSRHGRAFLLGSLHLARPEIYPLKGRILESFQLCNVLAVEADVSSPRGQELLEALSHYPEGQRLSRRLRPETLARLRGAGVDMETVDHMRPWYLAMSLQLRMLGELGFEQRYGIDLHFLNRAGEQGKRVVELEGLELQTRMLDELAGGDEDLLLEHALEELTATRAEAEPLFQAWLSGDIRHVEDLISRTFLRNPAFQPLHEKLIVERNKRMAGLVREMIERGDRPFVIVGAGHLVGRESLVELLSAMGFAVDRT
jgi:uncharacterized protein